MKKIVKSVLALALIVTTIFSKGLVLQFGNGKQPEIIEWSPASINIVQQLN